jgi:hypothetical protein
MTRVTTSSWHRLRESTEGPNVTIEIPREWAEELLRSLATALEIEDDGGEEPDAMGMPHTEPDEDDLGGADDGDGDADGTDELDFDLPAGDDAEDDEEPDEDDDDDEDDEEDEAVDFSGSDRGTRPKTALGEGATGGAWALVEKHIGFKKLKGELSHERGVKDPGALAAAIGRKKYGAKGMARKAAAGRRK